MQTRGIVVAGLRGGGGKSVVAVGLAAALRQEGLRVAAFKKGPDYIDAGWLGLAAGSPCRNLDFYLMEADSIRRSFAKGLAGADCVIVEGNRGLFDGVDDAGTYSTAELAKVLGLPVLLVIDCEKITRTVAALALGCRMLDPDVVIAGVVLNRVATARQEKIIRKALCRDAGMEVLGVLPRVAAALFPQRHLGVLPVAEHAGAAAAVAALAAAVAGGVDCGRVRELMASPRPDALLPTLAPLTTGGRRRLGIVRDAAFQFYYPENLQALMDEGAELVEVSALSTPILPDLDGLYIGGGFPETSGRELAANGSFRQSLLAAVKNGLPVYAECGGLIYLGRLLVVDGQSWPMAGLFPVDFAMSDRPQGHGYSAFVVDRDNPFYPLGFRARGHEFRYSRVLRWDGRPEELALAMERGEGFMAGRDGLVTANVLALYTHLHALATPEWAGLFMARLRSLRDALQ